jgi:peptidyl-prolyl cis-trans isomerase SurA
MFSQAGQDKILMTVHDREITIGEFERYYRKDASALGTVQSADEYIEHFINFKLKVIEAEELGYDTTEAFIKEYTGYHEQLAEPYLTKMKDMEDLLKPIFISAILRFHANRMHPLPIPWLHLRWPLMPGSVSWTAKNSIQLPNL